MLMLQSIQDIGVCGCGQSSSTVMLRLQKVAVVDTRYFIGESVVNTKLIYVRYFFFFFEIL